MVEIMESARASTSPKRICVVKHGISRHIPAGCGYDIRLRIHVEEWRIVILNSVIKAKSSLVIGILLLKILAALDVVAFISLVIA